MVAALLMSLSRRLGQQLYMRSTMGRKNWYFYDLLFSTSSVRLRPSRETAWLDGVRGMAAFLVMLHHYNMSWLSAFADAPFGSISKSNRNADGVWYYKQGQPLLEFWRLPFLRIMMTSGNAQVAVFFVLSGFVLSWGPLKLMRSGQDDKLFRSIGSSIVRRWFRLFLPCIAVSVIYLLDMIVRYRSGFVPIMEELWRFVYLTEHWARPFNVGHQLPMATANPYGFIMWTIPFEFSGSIYIYVTLLAVARIPKYSRRLMVMMLITSYTCLTLHWAYWLFGTGLMLADYVQLAGSFQKLSERMSRRSSYFWCATFVVGVYLMGFPPVMDWYTTPMYYRWFIYVPFPGTMKDFFIQGRLWWGLGGILSIASSCHFEFVRKLYELPIPQYLGKISFMLYLIHVFVNDLIGFPFRAWIYIKFFEQEHSDLFGGQILITTPLANFAIHMLLMVICGSVSIGLAHILEIYVDRPCTKVGKIIDINLVGGIVNKPSVSQEEERLLHSTHLSEVEMEERLPR